MRVTERLREWANSTNTSTPPGWHGDRASGYGPGEGDRLHDQTPRRRAWPSTNHTYDALGRVQVDADPAELVGHVFDNRLNALGLADWLERKGPGRAQVAFLLIPKFGQGVGGA